MFQELLIVGTLGRDPEMRYTPEGKATATISVATNRKTAKGDEETTWFRVTCWDKTAEYVNKFMQKGSKIVVRGRLVVDPVSHGPRIYTRQDGTPAANFEVVAETVKGISGFKNVGEQAENQQRQNVPAQRQQPKQTDFVDDIPW